MIYLLSLLVEKSIGNGLNVSQSSALEFGIISSIDFLDFHYRSASCLVKREMMAGDGMIWSLMYM